MTTIEEYKKEYGVFGDVKMNKRILSLARRNKFYLPQIQSIIKGGGWSLNPKSYIIWVAKKQVRKDYKIVGFSIATFSGGWGGSERFSTSLEYWLVDKAFQNQGIGKQLYEKVIDFSNEIGNPNLKVMFKTDDENLEKLYTKLDFKPVEKYDGKIQKIQEGKHTLWWKIVWEKVDCFGNIVDLMA